jgi:hypothetical protein
VQVKCEGLRGVKWISMITTRHKQNALRRSLFHNVTAGARGSNGYNVLRKTLGVILTWNFYLFWYRLWQVCHNETLNTSIVHTYISLAYIYVIYRSQYFVLYIFTSISVSLLLAQTKENGDDCYVDVRSLYRAGSLITGCGMDWIHLAHDRNQSRALMNTVMNLRVP